MLACSPPLVLLEQCFLLWFVLFTRTLPPIFFHIHFIFYEFHSLLLEQGALSLRTRPLADLSLRVDDALPGHIIRAGSHGTAHPARTESLVAVKLHTYGWRDHQCNLPIACHFAARDLPDQGPHLFVIRLLVGRGGISHGK